MTYKSVVATKYGGPEVLKIVENELRPPGDKEVRIKVLAASVSQPDIATRQNKTLYAGTPLKKKTPFVPGYSVVGTIDALGDAVSSVNVGDRVGVLATFGGYTEYLYWRSDRLIPVPVKLDPIEAVILILNYIVAYQALHRKANVQSGEIALIVGASGGLGTALMQLGFLANLKMYGLASKSKHYILDAYGVVPIDYRSQDFVELLRQAEPAGIDVALDGMMRPQYINGSLSLLRRGGRLVSFGDPGTFKNLLRILGTLVITNLLPNGKSIKLYGTSTYFVGNSAPYYEDWATLFRLLEEGKIEPVITKRFPILEAARANALLESGTVVGNVVLASPELL